jgi:hypothetical protein
LRSNRQAPPDAGCCAGDRLGGELPGFGAASACHQRRDNGFDMRRWHINPIALQAGGGQAKLFSALKKQGVEDLAQLMWDWTHGETQQSFVANEEPKEE